MIEGFDKEIDALLRQTAKSETASANNNLKSEIRNPKSEIHLDADEISAFAENALPEKIKLKYTAHFADCDRCRTILSNIITLHSEAETIAASSVVSPLIVEAKTLPWHRKLFAFPNLAYALGALVVLFGGFIAFNVVRNVNDATGSADVSQISESQPTAGGPSFDGEQDFINSNSASSTMSNAMSSNSASANMSSNMMMSNAASATGIARQTRIPPRQQRRTRQSRRRRRLRPRKPRRHKPKRFRTTRLKAPLPESAKTKRELPTDRLMRRNFKPSKTHRVPILYLCRREIELRRPETMSIHQKPKR
jgi:hypothetical protein